MDNAITLRVFTVSPCYQPVIFPADQEYKLEQFNSEIEQSTRELLVSASATFQT